MCGSHSLPRTRVTTVIEFLAGLVLIVAWILLQFVQQATTGLIHLLLAAGVLLVIRGITKSRWANPDSN
jgi:hypothetical protein